MTLSAPTNEKINTVQAAQYARRLKLQGECEALDRAYIAAVFGDAKTDQRELTRLTADRHERRAELAQLESDLEAVNEYRSAAAIAEAEASFAKASAIREDLADDALAAITAITVAATVLEKAQAALDDICNTDCAAQLQQTIASRAGGLTVDIPPYLGPGLGVVAQFDVWRDSLARDAATVSAAAKARKQ